MAITELLSVVIPPDKPMEAGDKGRLADVRAMIGLDLPTDFLEMGIHYGSGHFVDDKRIAIELFNPFSPRYMQRVTDHCRILEQLKQFGDDEVPFPIFPAVPGLLPWGKDDNGGKLYWLTRGSPSEWPVVAKPPRSEYFEEHTLDTTSFLARVFARKIDCVLWRDNPEARFFIGPDPVFFLPGVDLNPNY